ncbi:primosomal protein N' [Kitasatospora kifunensis]|uniref:Probable replication restart protein PriA n=1 Tax=Kitasatospora kifunensis TaxID=58351 RepID=A0A7W7R8M1_KITKI|nr:primosomal protein N' [Kitasatospora kifunensis]MBB4926831.1 primosomal protein N' (replication factor Y) [Kitasatospora kifunensis]
MSSDDTPPGGPPEQLALIRETVRRAKPRTWHGAHLAEELPVARVVVDKGLLHLDQFFDYAVPVAMAETAQPGVRVRVRFGARVSAAGRREGGELHDGFIVARLASSDFRGPLAPLAQVLSPERVLTPALLKLSRTIADRYAGTLADVLQLAVPPRHAKAEAEPSPPPQPPPAAPPAGSWQRYPQGPEFLAALTAGHPPRAVWTALPGPSWPQEIALAVAATLAGGRGALVVLPDGRAVARVDAALTELLGGPERHAVLTADLGPKERYRNWLAVSRGSVRAVLGTRATVFAPVHDLGLLVVWSDGDSSHSDPRAPHPHVREIALLRAAEEGAAVLLGGLAMTVEGAQLLRTGWARPLAADRAVVRETAPRVRTVGEADQARDAAAQAARLPSVAWQAAREALRSGPVLVQVPRRGYVPRLACGRCRTPARCAHCAGPLEAVGAGEALQCAWCGIAAADWHCVECGSFRLRAQVVGARRTAEELGKAFPGIPVRTSGRDAVLAGVSAEPALVISTPGAEPVAEGSGYAAALLLDGWALLSRPDLRSGEETLRLWLAAAALVRPAAEGGLVVVVAEPTARPVQALVRWDPAGHADLELAERAQLGFPPVSRMAAVTGSPGAVADLLGLARLPEGADLLGPVPLPPVRGQEQERALLRVRPGQGGALAAALKAAQIARVALRGAEPVKVRIDPTDIG